MALVVQKFGGTSVGSVERIQKVAQRVYETAQAGHQVVVVVSAMGKTTDQLVGLAESISSNPSGREMDMLLSTGEQVSIALLSMALQELGQPALSLTGAQVGIVTETSHSRARILEIKPDRAKKHLQKGEVVVVAGFQGITNGEDIEITTLGRGGSDTSAVALAAALQADYCEIYTDVPGILTTDPRIVPEAQLMSEVTCDEMLELASLGAKVLHPRAVEIARNYGVTLVVRSSWSNEPGTKVISPLPKARSLTGLEIGKAVDSVQLDTSQGQVALLRVPDSPGVAGKLFGEIAGQSVDVDLIIQSIHEGNTNDIAFTVDRKVINTAEAVASAIAPALGKSDAVEVMTNTEMATVAITGAGMIGRPGIAAEMFTTLAEAGVNIRMISTSEVKIGCVVDKKDSERAINALCEAFDLSSSPVAPHTPKPTEKIKNIPVRGVALDTNQTQIAIRHVPDYPGRAAKVFGELAQKGISVDMIIQSQRSRLINQVPSRDIAFTVSKIDAEITRQTLESLLPEIGAQDVLVEEDIAKVSLVGAGMVGTPGVAATMFKALAQQQINIQMITTSEIKISCVVAKSQGETALRVIHQVFNLHQPDH
ncbi:aspartate kinase [Euhalothece natronophila Z-M001]|uniref:aspartate kinase n=1 Tax=Euhalothece natronophila Z-M001 TaxID=522448 RepID=A0A5B8NNB5_9CHRO|nr:aspartate kinase [Euhalothece natronophila]QDZ40051.1 aspartate kinase [Euhalothece natronophila Z-M001]